VAICNGPITFQPQLELAAVQRGSEDLFFYGISAAPPGWLRWQGGQLQLGAAEGLLFLEPGRRHPASRPGRPRCRLWEQCGRGRNGLPAGRDRSMGQAVERCQAQAHGWAPVWGRHHQPEGGNRAVSGLPA